VIEYQRPEPLHLAEWKLVDVPLGQLLDCEPAQEMPHAVGLELRHQ
jgi:hypothetical protein